MQDLQMFPRASVQDAANDLQEQYRLGAINKHELGVSLSRFVLRDPEGSYCAYDARQRRWYRYVGENWKLAAGAAACLEGPAELPVDRPLAKEETASDAPSPDRIGTDQEPVTSVLARIVRRLAETYASGEISLADANQILQSYVLIDLQGRVWVPGARTGTWHAYARGAWKAHKGPPREEDLVWVSPQRDVCQFCGAALKGLTVCPNCRKPVPPPFALGDEAKMGDLGKSLLEAADSLPEALSEPWEPPAWYPDAVEIDGLVCPTCQEENKAGSNFCSRCGTVLAPLRMETAPPVPTKFCTHCGTELKPGRKFCSSCGKPVAEKSEHGLPR